MKIILLTILLFINLCAVAQNIGIGTETPQFKLHIKGTVDTTQLVIDANTTQTNTHPLILLRNSLDQELFRIHAPNGSDLFIGYRAGALALDGGIGLGNTFIGSSAGSVNTTGYSNTVVGFGNFRRNTTGIDNVTVGYQSLSLNTDGNWNTAVGSQALHYNSRGVYNTALGYNSLLNNDVGDFNTAIGVRTLTDNLSNNNTAVGAFAMDGNQSGFGNTAIGVTALVNNKGAEASYNTAVGNEALYGTTNSQYNTALGYKAGFRYDNGYNNVFVGANTDVNGAGYFNVIAIGQATVCTASSQVTIGNGATNSYRAYANWSNISDGRFKKNIQENVPGLAFITQLRPVTYNLTATELDNFLHSNDNILQPADNTGATKTGSSERQAAPVVSEMTKAAIAQALKEKEQAIQTGFVAQEVEATAKKLGFNFSGIDAPVNDKDVYGLRYAEFVVPLVKAVQEQQVMIKKQDELIAILQQQIAELKTLIKK